jgi:hypothetical protein
MYTFWKRTVAPPNKRVIYLFQSGAPSQMDLFRLQAGVKKPARQGASRFDPEGAAADRHDGDANQLPHRAKQVSLRSPRSERRVDQ